MPSGSIAAQNMNRFAVLACVGYGALAVSGVTFVVWGTSASSQPGESWEAWNHRIELLWTLIQGGLAVGGIAGLMALVIPSGGQPGRLIAALPSLGAISILLFIYRVMTSLQIQ